MKTIEANAQCVAYCGLYCGACGAYRKERCPGCHGNEKATWCKVRTCCIAKGYASCADCTQFSDPRDCRMFNNAIAKLIGFVLRSDRAACIQQIKSLGLEGHAQQMAAAGRQSIRRS